MKKRLCALLLGVVFVTTSAVTAFAENDDNTAAIEERPGVPTPTVSTGTYERALEDVTDVDEDIKENVEAVIPEQMEEINIGSTEEFLAFANNCKLDTWSVNKKVTLTSDISLLGCDFTGIPSFGGIFDGAGHTISSFNVDKGMSYIGLFTEVQSTAVITNLKVQGSIIPSGEQINIGGIAAINNGYIHKCSYTGVINGNDYVGGVVGVNKLTGVLDDCSCSGYVHGVHFTGGIVGQNNGYVLNCVNDSLVNTTNTDTQITIDSMSTLNKVISLVKNVNSTDEDANADVTASDTGGIAGQSLGIMTNCINTGDIGYEHVGYNVGGIAGRHSGYMFKCTNSAKVLGRKDVGGVVGQAEPYITVDLSTDIAYQLSEAIGKLHDLVTVTLRDTKNQSNVISNRLSIIQGYTGNALNDVKYIANGTIDYANGISGSATEAFARVDYVLDEATKEGGALDHTEQAIGNVKDSAVDIRSAFSKLDIDYYIDETGNREEYNAAKEALEGIEGQYNVLYKSAFEPYKNYYIYNHKGEYTNSSDLEFVKENGDVLDPQTQMAILNDSTITSTNDIIEQTHAATPGYWQHKDTDKTRFPASSESHVSYSDDNNLNTAAESYAAEKAASYAMNMYTNAAGEKGSQAYLEDVATNTAKAVEIITDATSLMADDVRVDAVNGIEDIERAAENLKNAGRDTRSILNNIAGRDNIVFPTFSDEYKARTASFVDNMQGMNDNFGLLNSEMNGATGILVDDLQAVTDQFNTIMLLFSDAADGVLEMDYTHSFEDVSLDEADTCTDATIDSCVNYGKVEGDIDVAGVAGTMAIEYEYDKESDITGIKDSKMSTSYLTKCVIRGCNNYNNAVGEKNYVGGICGLQEMGTIKRCANMGNLKSSSGEYVGGVCGRSISNVVESTSSGILDGASYVGGITGDGMHISNCQSLVKIENSDSWFGAISGHVDEKGVVRDNYFYSDDLAGIDRSSYTAKAEPKSFDVSEVPYDFKSVTITFMLEDADLPNGEKVIKKSSQKYGSSIEEKDYPRVDDKAGYYVTWDRTAIDNLKTDEVITATYTKYRTTIGEESTSGDDSIHQGRFLVDGQFREEDKLTIEWTNTFDPNSTEEMYKEGKTLYQEDELLHISIPDDGQKKHRVRYRLNPEDMLKEMGFGYGFFLVGEDGSLNKLEKTGSLGEYDTYEIEGNDVTIDVRMSTTKLRLYSYAGIAIAALILLILVIALVAIYVSKNGGLLPKLINKLAKNVSKKIEDKEQLFYDDSQEDKTLFRKDKDNASESEISENEVQASSDTEPDAEVKTETEAEPKEPKSTNKASRKKNRKKAKK
ncbi:hypothetical protein [Butyrivibrio sp. VCB2006]|uniref:hypothetical protein n=1 Tax=Butyrivibrio sp. VCB2006 TaxID=1280679 RepID=UPI0003F9F402|nr:hypothetical protein [Butyrivibrio sp. VCB2006]